MPWTGHLLRESSILLTKKAVCVGWGETLSYIKQFAQEGAQHVDVGNFLV